VGGFRAGHSITGGLNDDAGGPCDCCCTYMDENFVRTIAPGPLQLSADGVNFIRRGQPHTRWLFNASAAVVDTTENKLQLLSGDNLLFYDKDLPELFAVYATVAFTGPGQVAKIIVGGTEVILTLVDEENASYSFGGHTQEIELDPPYVYGDVFSYGPNSTLFYAPFLASKFPDIGKWTCPSKEGNLVQHSPDLEYVSSEFGAGYTQWGIGGSPGVEFHSVTVLKAHPDCIAPQSPSCKDMCGAAGLPDSITISVSGYPDRKTVDSESLEAALDACAVGLAACMEPVEQALEDHKASCALIHGDGTPDYHVCVNEYISTTYSEQLCECYDQHQACRCSLMQEFCTNREPSCSEVNGSHVLDRVPDTCTYAGTLPNPYDELLVAGIEATINIVDYSDEDGLTCQIVVDFPLCLNTDILPFLPDDFPWDEQAFFGGNLWESDIESCCGWCSSASASLHMASGQKFFAELTRMCNSADGCLDHYFAMGDLPCSGPINDACGHPQTSKPPCPWPPDGWTEMSIGPIG
jgi:hypothetical protein